MTTEGGITYYIVKDDGKEDIMRADGKWAVPLDKNYANIISALGDKYIKVYDNGHYGVITLDGKEVISTSRGYTYIGDYNSARGTFTFTKRGIKGVCNISEV